MKTLIYRIATPLAHRKAHVAMVASVLAAGLVVQPTHAAEPASRVIQLPTVVVIAKRTPVAQLETVVVVSKRTAPVATFLAERTAPAAALKVGNRV